MLRIMSDSLMAFGEQSPEDTASLASSHKRPVTARSCSPAKKSDCKGRKRQKSGRLLGKPENSGLSFACPFYKWNPEVYGGENGCSGWCNENIETVVRHHVLDKHRKANKARIANNRPPFLDDERFEDVVKYKRQRSSGKSKEKHAEETWKAVYTLLFGAHLEARDEILDPYFVSTTRPNNSGYSIDEIEKILQRPDSKQPSLLIECQNLIVQHAKIERERERAKEDLRLTTDRKKAPFKAQINEAKARIREIEEYQARAAQEIDADFDKRSNNNRVRMMALVNGEPDPQTGFPNHPLPLPVAHLGTSFDFPFQTAGQVSPSLLSGSVQGYADTQSGFVERNPDALLHNDDSIASPTGTSTQVWSSGPSSHIHPYEICNTALSNGSYWCEEECSLPSVD
jgi:hypothetical protein